MTPSGEIIKTAPLDEAFERVSRLELSKNKPAAKPPIRRTRERRIRILDFSIRLSDDDLMMGGSDGRLVFGSMLFIVVGHDDVVVVDIYLTIIVKIRNQI